MRSRLFTLKTTLILALIAGLALIALPAMADTPTDPTAMVTQVPDEIKEGEGIPKKEKQFVYGLSPWTGKDYSGTFAPEQAKTIYFIADEISIVNSLRSEVYYWPITQEYMADWFGYKEEVAGKLEIYKAGESKPMVFEKTAYCYSYPNGYDGGVVLMTGVAAYEEFARFNKAYEDFYAASTQYYEDRAEWDKTMDKMIKQVQKTGKPYKQSEIPLPPVEPEPPKLFTTEPVIAFLVKLPAGNYRMRLVGDDGKVVKGSEKKLKVFAPRRQGVGYEIIPESRWTSSFASDDSTQVIYSDGKRTFYLKGFYELEYNLFDYSRMISLHKPLEGLGTKSTWIWAHTSEVPDTKLQLLKNGKVIDTLEMKPFYVEQTEGYSLGYKIVDFDPTKPENQYSEPSFYAFKVDVEAKGGDYRIRLVDKDNNVIAGSERQIRSVRTSKIPLYTIPVLPLIAGVLVFFWRRSLSGSGETAA